MIGVIFWLIKKKRMFKKENNNNKKESSIEVEFRTNDAMLY